MKIKPLCLAMLMFGLSSTAAMAADGTLHFKGHITNSSCTIKGATIGADGVGENFDINIPMGRVPVHILKRDTKGPEVGFSVTVENCLPGTYNIVLDGTSPANQPNVLALDAGSTAQGVGIQISDITEKPVTLTKSLDPNDAKIVINDQGDEGTFDLKASYYAYDRINISAGTADATAYFTIVEQ